MSKKDFMRCHACSHGTDINPDEPFIKLRFEAIDGYHVNAVQLGRNTKFELYVCPRCGTVRAEKELEG